LKQLHPLPLQTDFKRLPEGQDGAAEWAQREAQTSAGLEGLSLEFFDKMKSRGL
jgi:hypothetical protein